MIIADDDGWEEVEVEPKRMWYLLDSDEANAMSDIDSDHLDA
jgi:hypothetical protein